MDDRPRAVGIIFTARSGLRREHGVIVRSAGLDLFEPRDTHEALEVERHRRYGEHGDAAGVEMLMLGPERNLQRAALVPVEALSGDDAEAFARENVHRLFTVAMLPRMPAHRNLALEHVAAHRREAQRVRHHEFDLGILRRAHPRNVILRLQPLVVEGLHSHRFRATGNLP